MTSSNSSDTQAARDVGPLGDIDRHLFHEGRHWRLWDVLGAQLGQRDGQAGVRFAVWAPEARSVAVIGDFNHWSHDSAFVLKKQSDSAIWEGFVPGVAPGCRYKYLIWGHGEGLPYEKADPMARQAELPPATASQVAELPCHPWQDEAWLAERELRNRRDAPISIYEVHLGSWRRPWGEGEVYQSYEQLAEQLVQYVIDMGFTHVELMPIAEYPFDGSWGYQPVGLYAPTARFGPPDAFRAFVDAAHQAGIGVIIDWVPAHFPEDAHGLARFDGSALYEYSDPREGYHQDWNTLIYNFGRYEVANFLVANALYWLDEFHIDGLRVDAVASMLYRDYSRDHGEWVPNIHGGRENLEAIAFLRSMNTEAYGQHPGIATFAEESTAFPGVSRPVDAGGLGFGFKWNMGWMNDTLRYMQEDPLHRRHHHHLMTFGIHYAYTENFVLPISHDEVVHGKGSMLNKMPGERANQFAQLRAYYGFMWGHPGKKLLFMGCEFAQRREWDHDGQLDWSTLEDPAHKGMQQLVRDLNDLYRSEPSLHVHDCAPEGFEWLVNDAADESVFAWLRKGHADHRPILVVVNMTPVERQWSFIVPVQGRWLELLNTDAGYYGGGNRGNQGVLEPVVDELGSQLSVYLPPLSAVFLAPEMATRDQP